MHFKVYKPPPPPIKLVNIGLEITKKFPVGIMKHPRPFQINLQMLATGRVRAVWKVLAGNNLLQLIDLDGLQLNLVVVQWS